jgi:PPOX class probable F420-dependent enzyme
MLSADVLAFLRAPRCAVIATHESDGGIRQAVVWYFVTPQGILMNSLQGRRWLTNLRRDPRLTMAVVDGEEYVILRGTVVVVDDPDRGQAEAMALARQYGGDPDAHAGQVRVSVLFDPEGVALHGRLAASAVADPAEPEVSGSS